MDRLQPYGDLQTAGQPPGEAEATVADQPGVLARIATVLGDHQVSVKSVVQRGIGEDARLVMVLHECLESRFARAVEALNELGELRGPARSIHVIEERS